MNDYVGDPYPYAKVHHDTITPLRLPQICENAHQVTFCDICCFRSASGGGRA